MLITQPCPNEPQLIDNQIFFLFFEIARFLFGRTTPIIDVSFKFCLSSSFLKFYTLGYNWLIWLFGNYKKCNFISADVVVLVFVSTLFLTKHRFDYVLSFFDNSKKHNQS